MIFHVLTIFPEFFRGPFEHGVVARGGKSGLLQIRIHNLRDWTFDFHKSVDDRPFGGGEGMVLKAQPIFEAAETVLPERDRTRQRIALLSAHGPLFDQRSARRLLEFEEVLLICGRYEGVDERVSQHLADEEISIGDYVLSGGELAAAVVVDAVARLIPGVLGNEESSQRESFCGPGEDAETESGQAGILDCPHYTRPAVFRGWSVPEVLLGGNHAEIRKWRNRAALEKTKRLRADLLGPRAGGRTPERE
ncbi:MAG: tRNA (guanosine(37)-N1)-methyltransferase TrmD [Candidatus Solibacter usitatus]|nr:tRNA (guanosine(37)-N1)-methyltransferase TrmD [Candidatus Solibacter usitatus]